MAYVNFRDVKEGDTVTRLMAETVETQLRVTAVDETLIHCAGWAFDRATGVEVDDFLMWGPLWGQTGSRLVRT